MNGDRGPIESRRIAAHNPGQAALLGAAVVLAAACAPAAATSAPPASTTTSAAPPASPAPPATSVAPAVVSAASLQRVVRARPHPDAPPELSAQFGRLVGSWRCQSAQRQPDGSWKDGPGEATWTWFYTLDGHAVQDIWEGSAEGGGGIGVNLRVWDDEAKTWHLAWATTGQRDIASFTAAAEGETLVMRGDQPTRGPFPAHRARITFHTIEDASFQWKYEASPPTGAASWREFSRIRCRRLSD
ncbi:MAG: hypothetical protein AAGC55_30435 [Myxococcota bacterium]